MFNHNASTLVIDSLLCNVGRSLAQHQRPELFVGNACRLHCHSQTRHPEFKVRMISWDFSSSILVILCCVSTWAFIVWCVFFILYIVFSCVDHLVHLLSWDFVIYRHLSSVVSLSSCASCSLCIYHLEILSSCIVSVILHFVMCRSSWDFVIPMLY